jgi:Zn ribbon nucleic-acid-binding protein
VKAGELVDAVQRAGGVLELQGDKVMCRLPRGSAHLVDALQEHKQELIILLRARGGRVAAFPHCPQCASFALYRENNAGLYECLTCGLLQIEESVARRLVQR